MLLTAFPAADEAVPVVPIVPHETIDKEAAAAKKNTFAFIVVLLLYFFFLHAKLLFCR